MTTERGVLELVADCRLRAATDLLRHTWDPVVLAALSETPRRRHHLRVRIGGISDKSLTASLRRLVANGLVERQRYAESPPRTDYVLTPLGASFRNGPLAVLGRWIADHGDDLLAVQEGRGDP